MLFIDMIDVPFAFLGLMIVLTGWRFPELYTNLSRAKTRNLCRKVVLSQFAFWLLDILTFFAFVIVMVTVYRAPQTLRNLHMWFSSQHWGKNEDTSDVKASESNENPAVFPFVAPL